MSRSIRTLSVAAAAFAIVGLGLAGCATSSGDSPSASPASEQTIQPDPDLGAAWLDGGRIIGLVTLGSSTCVYSLADEATYTDGVLHVEFAAPDSKKPCTTDLVPRVTLVGVPEDVDPEENLQIEVTGDEYFGQVELEGVPGLASGGETDYLPSAGWATVKGQFVILTWGSSTCLPVIEDVAATGPAEVTATYATPPTDQVCTMDMVGQGAVTSVNDLEETSDVNLVMTGGEFDNIRIPIYGTN